VIENSALAIVLAAGLFFLILGGACFVAPSNVGRFLLGFADSPLKHYGELALRGLVGGAFVFCAPQMLLPGVFSVFGWVLLATTGGLLLVPWRWHRRFARRTVPQALRFLPLVGISSTVLGGAVLAAVILGNAHDHMTTRGEEMPYLNIKIAAAESTETSGKVAALLTDLTASVLGKKRELTAVAIEYAQPRSWFVAGKNVALPTFYLDIKVTEGTNTKDEKAAYIKRVFSGLSSILGELAPASYIVIHEIRGDAWGYQAETQEFRYIQGRPL